MVTNITKKPNKFVFALAAASRPQSQREDVLRQVSLGRGFLGNHGHKGLRTGLLSMLNPEPLILETTV